MQDTKLNIQWYPGHMTKTRRELETKLKLIDLVIEVLDARAPLATSNPDFQSLFGQKKRMYILNKADMANDETTKAWVQYFEERAISAVAFSALRGNPKDLLRHIQAASREISDRYAKKGMKKTVRALVCGIPNVGKSAILNRLAGQKKLKEGNMPGVTRGLQWIRLTPYLELMDSPGMLPPKIENIRDGAIIASIGSIRREILDEDRLIFYLLDMLASLAPEQLRQRYQLTEDMQPLSLLEQICKNRNYYVSKGKLDYERAVSTVFDDLKNGRLRNISFESPEEPAHG